MRHSSCAVWEDLRQVHASGRGQQRMLLRNPARLKLRARSQQLQPPTSRVVRPDAAERGTAWGRHLRPGCVRQGL